MLVVMTIKSYIDDIIDDKNYYKLSIKPMYYLKFNVYDSKSHTRIILGSFEQNKKILNYDRKKWEFNEKSQNYFINTNKILSVPKYQIQCSSSQRYFNQFKKLNKFCWVGQSSWLLYPIEVNNPINRTCLFYFLHFYKK